MSAIGTILLISGGIGAVAFIANWFTSRSGEKSNIMEAVHNFTQKLGQEKIDKIEGKQNKIKTEITIKEDIAEATKIKITKIQETAAAEITEVLKEDNIGRIHTIIDNEWENL
ncbi:hypothetical protein LCGC14_2612750 [marine sediment metagenome]|uniref:Uncharacterized protein n=1 Tax=marine sediment metagenome TaxID=412755 RepID=A0A0F9CGJ2_9ZZZZ